MVGMSLELFKLVCRLLFLLVGFRVVGIIGDAAGAYEDDKTSDTNGPDDEPPRRRYLPGTTPNSDPSSDASEVDPNSPSFNTFRSW